MLTEKNKMLNLNKHTKTKAKRKPIRKFKNCSHVCAYHCAQLSYTMQHRTVLIIFPPNLQTIVIAQMLSTTKEGKLYWRQKASIKGAMAFLSGVQW